MNSVVENAINEKIFAVTPYYPDSDGRLLPVKITNCPLSTDEKRCKVVINHYRKRKTGPCIPLVVLECETHEKCFTLYPPGHVPYGRERIAPVSLDGDELKDQHGAPVFSGTLFDAALDASQEKMWPHSRYDGEVLGNTHARLETQKRHLGQAAFLLGIHEKLKPRRRDVLIRILSLPGQKIHD